MEAFSRGLNRQFLLIIGVVVLIRLAFLTQPVQGDDPYYLYAAQHAQIDPAHPRDFRFLFEGNLVDMRGHPHPPLNAWILGALLAVFGDVYEVPFHATYALLSVIAVVAMWSLARRFTEWPLGATLLFVSVPAFVINGNSFESDLPFLAFWMAGIAAFVAGRLSLAALCLGLAAMAAYQAVVATPILWVYCWLHARESKPRWAVALTPVLVIASYQLFERATTGTLPATVLAGYFSSYGLQQIANKLKNAAALTAHTGWLVFPALAAFAFRGRWRLGVLAGVGACFVDPHPLFVVSFAVGAMVIASNIRWDFLSAWVALFFAAALVIFFAGSARYLLPMAAPVAMLASRERRWVWPAFAANLALALALAWTNYQHWDAYRRVVGGIRQEMQERRVWTTSEWGLRFYLESEGALPLTRDEIVQPGQWLVSSALATPFNVTAPTATVLELDVTTTLPLRLIGLNSRSGYSTAMLGLRPFDISSAPIDRVRVEAVLERRPTLSYLPMNAPEAQAQIVTGVYDLQDTWRWTGGKAIVLLKPPAEPKPLRVKYYIHDSAAARRLRVRLDDTPVGEHTAAGPGVYTFETKPISGSAVTLEVDKTFSPPGDLRKLGVILMEVGFVP
ncbi:MAG TPA: hypothetical protein VER03_09185 [Bryobacteraceae bacterium]|nr:hypothetical protein [Bryobacteraceae bacterium]